MPDEIIRASEVGQYAFCARAWWLRRVQGYPSGNVEAMEAGTAAHRAHGRAVVAAHRLRRLAYFFLAAGLALMVWSLWRGLGAP